MMQPTCGVFSFEDSQTGEAALVLALWWSERVGRAMKPERDLTSFIPVVNILVLYMYTSRRSLEMNVI
jgi:hypothetical protein